MMPLGRYGENSEGGQQPSLNVFVRSSEKIYHSYHSKLLLVPPEPGQNERHVDMIWRLWNLPDLALNLHYLNLHYLPSRGADWYPSLTYRDLHDSS